MPPSQQDWLWWCDVQSKRVFRRRRPRITGFRFIRGSHSGTFVSDPNGTDTPPAGYFTKGRTFA